MSIDIGGVLGLLSGSPILKAGVSFVEKLKHAKSMDIGSLGALVPGLMGASGLASIMQNPVSALTSGLQSQIGDAISSLTGSGFDQTLSALADASGLGDVASQFSQVTNALSGVAAAVDGGFGLMDLISHANTVDALGAFAGPLSTVNAASPLTSETLLSSSTQSVTSIAAAVLAGTLPDAQGAQQIMAVQTQLQDVLTTSSNAIGGMRALLPTVAAAHMVGAVLVQATSRAPGDPTLAALLPTMVQPAALAALQTAAADMIAL